MRIATKRRVFMENSATTGFQQFLKVIGRVMAVCAAAFVIMAREGFGPRYFDALGKALFYRQREAGLAQAYADASLTIAANMMDPSASEGVDAFLQKRPPNWKP